MKKQQIEEKRKSKTLRPEIYISPPQQPKTDNYTYVTPEIPHTENFLVFQRKEIQINWKVQHFILLLNMVTKRSFVEFLKV